MFIPRDYRGNEKQLFKVCDEVRKTRPWQGIYSNKNYNVVLGLVKKYKYDDEKFKYKYCTISTIYDDTYYSIVDYGNILKCDQFFLFRKLNNDIKLSDVKIDINLCACPERKHKMNLVSGNDYNLYSEYFDDFNEDVIIYESKNISHPTNIASGQCYQFGYNLKYDNNLLEFIGIIQTILPIGHNRLVCWGPRKDGDKHPPYEFLFGISTYGPLTSIISDKKYLEDYCISLPSDESIKEKDIIDYREPTNKYTLNKSIFIRLDIMFDKKECDSLIKIHTDNVINGNFTIIDEKIVSVLSVKPLKLYNIHNWHVFPTYRILKYEEGVESKAHTDFPEFNPTSTHRLLIYLNDDYEGGHIKFIEKPEFDFDIHGGFAIIFNMSMPHYAEKVTKGTKYIITAECTPDLTQMIY